MSSTELETIELVSVTILVSYSYSILQRTMPILKYDKQSLFENSFLGVWGLIVPYNDVCEVALQLGLIVIMTFSGVEDFYSLRFIWPSQVPYRF